VRACWDLPPAGGFLNSVDVLLAAGADINLADKNDLGYTPLIRAAREGQLSMVQRLVEKGSNLETGDSRGGTAILQSCIGAHRDVLEYLIGFGGNVVGADKGSFESCARLLDFGADKDAGDMYGFTPLIGAVVGGYERIVQLLLDNGADKNKKVLVGYEKVAAGDTAVEVAVKLGREAIIQMLGGDKFTSVL
jgi:ankyrin repeat protein